MPAIHAVWEKRKPESASVVIPVGVLLLPTPGIFAHIFERFGGFPAQLTIGFRGIGVAFRNITGTAGRKFIRNLFTHDFFKSIVDFQNRVAFARPQVIDAQSTVGCSYNLSAATWPSAGQPHGYSHAHRFRQAWDNRCQTHSGDRVCRSPPG